MELIKAINKENFEFKVREACKTLGLPRNLKKSEITAILDTYISYLSEILSKEKFDCLIEAIYNNINFAMELDINPQDLLFE